LSEQPNILFIMADQLRADYLSCNGHPTIETPALDGLARRGVNFSRAYCQGPVCGSSRASFYTGRYVASHGVSYNGVPLRVGETTMGDHLRPHGYRVALVGKTHMKADHESLQRLGLDPSSDMGVLVSQCGFEPFERDDGLRPDQSVSPTLRYNQWLRGQGYKGDNPWHEYANSAVGSDGEILSGWYMRHARLPARVQEEHSETAYMTDRAMDFIGECTGRPWCLHLSYIKPHWPYIAPAPYHQLYDADRILPVNRAHRELAEAHPVVKAFMQHAESVLFADETVRRTVIPTYMGLIRQIDDHLARLFEFLDQRDLTRNTVIVFTSDHGDYLGDHWLGEKELFHEETARIPMIVVDPRPAADATRGTTDDRLVEAIDLLPSFVEVAGGQVPDHILEGRSLLPLLRGEPLEEWRDAIFSEADYAWRPARTVLRQGTDEARAYMTRTARWKYAHFNGHRPQLFDLESDPGELCDLGASPAHSQVRSDLKGLLFDWMSTRRGRTTVSNETVARDTGAAHEQGYLFGCW
jgi:arylsulfatase A-like enzyme